MPPDEHLEQIGYDLDEALTLLGALEDARGALIDSGHLAVVVGSGIEIRALSHKLGFDDPAEGTDGRRTTSGDRGSSSPWDADPGAVASRLRTPDPLRHG